MNRCDPIKSVPHSVVCRRVLPRPAAAPTWAGEWGADRQVPVVLGGLRAGVRCGTGVSDEVRGVPTGLSTGPAS